ncbi:MAG: LamG domain-containing protein [Spirochaetia bacterium]|nr:LamG domain-containing protein [Spirochaetia bacterium]
MEDIRGELRNLKRWVNVFILFFFFIFKIAPLYSINILWGEKNHPFGLKYLSDVEVVSKTSGEQNIRLKRQPYPVSFDESLNTLQISFDKSSNFIKSGEILKAEYKLKEFEDSIGEAASFEQPLHEMWVTPADFLFLNKEKNTGDFTIYFRIRPYQLKKRMDIFQKVGLFEGRKQGIVCGWEGGKLFFEFYNFFWHHDNPVAGMRIATRDTFQSNQFYSAMLIYRQNDGSLTLYLNGVEQEKIYLTSNFSQNGDILVPRFHKWDRSPLIIGRNFLGALDDMIFSNHILNPEIISGRFNGVEKNGDRYFQRQGIAVSNRIDLPSSQSKVERLKYDIYKPEGTDVKFYYRYSDIPFSADLDEIDLPYILMTSEFLSGVRGKYFQWKAELYANATGEITPVVYKVNLQYSANMAPMAPGEISVLDTGDSEVTFEFARSLEMDVVEGGRYHVYYGLKPYQPLGAIKYKSFSTTESGQIQGIPITDTDKWITDDQRYQNRIKITISNDIIRSNYSYFKQYPELLFQYPLLQKNIPYYFWVTTCDNLWTEKMANSDHESKPSPYVIVRLR